MLEENMLELFFVIWSLLMILRFNKTETKQLNKGLLRISWFVFFCEKYVNYLKVSYVTIHFNYLSNQCPLVPLITLTITLN